MMFCLPVSVVLRPVLLVLLLLWAGLPLAARAGVADSYDFRIESVRTPSGFRLEAHNRGVSPVSARVMLEGAENVAGLGRFPLTVVVPPQRTGMALGMVTAANPGRGMSFRLRYEWGLGDVRARHSPDARYRLPFRDGESFPVSQAAGGPVSTHSEVGSLYAVDIPMPVDTPIVAARAGTVVHTEFKHTRGGFTQDMEAEANVVLIQHADGSRAVYAHLAPGGVVVTPGQRVQEGEVIGLAGNTGFSSGPHLHFAVQVVRDNGQHFEYVSVPFKFYVGNPPLRFTPRFGMVMTADYVHAGTLPPLMEDLARTAREQQATDAARLAAASLLEQALQSSRTPESTAQAPAADAPPRTAVVVRRQEVPPKPVDPWQVATENRAALLALAGLVVFLLLYRAMRR